MILPVLVLTVIKYIVRDKRSNIDTSLCEVNNNQSLCLLNLNELFYEYENEEVVETTILKTLNFIYNQMKSMNIGYAVFHLLNIQRTINMCPLCRFLNHLTYFSIDLVFI